MATTANQDWEALSATFNSDYRDSVTESWKVLFDGAVTDPVAVLAAGIAAGVPARNTAYASDARLYVKSHSLKPDDGSRRLWTVTVNYEVPASTEFDPTQSPLLRPPVFNIEYTQSEYVIKAARNSVTLSHGDGKGGSRAANTEGPIVNAAGKRPDEPIIGTEQNAILVVRKNFADLATIAGKNNQFARTTNSDATVGFGIRTLKYLLTESEGQNVEGAITYWPGVTRIEVNKSTDLTLDNVGHDYWDATVGDWKFARYTKGEDKGQRMSEPVNLKLDGDRGGDTTTTITWRHLNAVPYQSLVT